MAKVYKTLQELGVPTWHPKALAWRKSRLHEIRSGELIGKKFRTKKGKEFVCKNIDQQYVYFYDIKMDRKHALFFLPTTYNLTKEEQVNWIEKNYPGSTLYIPKTGCQMHGDIDATLTLVDGTVYTIPWNY